MLLVLLVSCNNNNDDNSTSTTEPVTLTHPSGRVMAVGHYEPGTTTKTGEWKEYFDQTGSPQQWRRHYSAGVWDKSKDWREWNADQSIRNDASDY
jgi:hypothetical protein